ncbi:MAG: hypothetical protein QXX07_00165 [Candidatus Aenigmatarchaeota archaeon]
MIKKIVLSILLLVVLLMTLNFSLTSFTYHSSNFSLSLLFGFIVSSFLLFLLFKKKEEKILEKAGIKKEVEKNRIIEEYGLTKYSCELRKNIEYVSKIYSNIREKLVYLGYMETEEMKQLEERSRIVEEMLDSLYDALENLKKGREYNSVSSVEHAFKLSEDLPYSELVENLRNLATKMREAYTLKTIKLKELKN